MTITYRIHPSIGIARIGDSPTDFFVGPESPGVPPILDTPEAASSNPGSYKDAQHRIKRQGARFRIYACTEDGSGQVTDVQEITTSDARIEWEVHLVNAKAAAQRLDGAGRRNPARPESDLVIDAGAQRISGASQAMKALGGTFLTTFDVKLGDLCTDSAGRLIVLGGHGRSESVPDSPLDDFADNDGWCDDAADGPVRATVHLHGAASAVAATPAWVVVAPPDFAPGLGNVVTLYDAAFDVMARRDPALAVTDETPVSFTRDIYPILRCVSHLHHVSEIAARRHGPGASQHFLARLAELSSDSSEHEDARREIFVALRSPRTGVGRMPKVPRLALQKAPGTTITEVQYARMERWANGRFEADWPGHEPVPVALDDLPASQRPEALDRAAIEACVGGPFYPGIEVSRLVLEDQTYDPSNAFRINPTLAAGALTAPMAVPWQADFNDCQVETGADWWPAQRPNQVQRGVQRHAPWVPPEWNAPGTAPHRAMVDNWAQLGFVVETDVDGTVTYVEAERFVTP
jgi:hypothetical protein